MNVIFMSDILKVTTLCGSFSAIRVNEERREVFNFAINGDVLVVNGEEYTKEWAEAHDLCIFLDVNLKGGKFSLSWGDFEETPADGYIPKTYSGTFYGKELLQSMEEELDNENRITRFLRIYPKAPGWWRRIYEFPQTTTWQFGMTSELLADRGIEPDRLYKVTVNPGCPEYLDHCEIEEVTQ